MKKIVNKKDIEQLIQADDIFKQIYIRYGKPPSWKKPEGFITLANIILGQQVSLESANAHFKKLNDYLPAFIPKEILKLTDTEMRTCQISRQKSNYMRSLSSAILDEKINLELLSKMEAEDVRHQLKQIKGIGDWTADIYLMFCLQSKDIFPVKDVAIISTMKELSKCRTIGGILKCANKWKPYRSLATFFLWHYYLKKRNRDFV